MRKTHRRFIHTVRMLGFAVSALTQQVNAQSGENRLSLEVSPKVSYASTGYSPAYSNQLGDVNFSLSKQKPTQLINPLGQVVAVQVRPIRFGLDVGLRHTGEGGRGWSILLGGDWGRQLYGSNLSPTYSFKGYTIQGWYAYLSYWQVNGALTYYFPEQLIGSLSGNVFFRLNAHQVKGIRLIVNDKSVATAYPLDFTENGQGDLVTLQSYDDRSLLVEPEIGYALSWLEVSASASVPFQPSFTERHTFYQNKQVSSVNDIGYRLGGLYLNARLTLPVIHFARRKRAVAAPPEPRQPTAPQPSPVSPAPYSRGQMIRLNNVYFKASSAELLAESYPELNGLVEQLRQRPAVRIRLEGHTDIIGDAQLNQQLSEERVKTIQAYMVSKGVEQTRIETKGYGDKRPLKRNCPAPAGCPENRRVELVIVDN